MSLVAHESLVQGDTSVNFIRVAFISGALSWHGRQIVDRICSGNTEEIDIDVVWPRLAWNLSDDVDKLLHDRRDK